MPQELRTGPCSYDAHPMRARLYPQCNCARLSCCCSLLLQVVLGPVGRRTWPPAGRATGESRPSITSVHSEPHDQEGTFFCQWAWNKPRGHHQRPAC